MSFTGKLVHMTSGNVMHCCITAASRVDAYVELGGMFPQFTVVSMKKGVIVAC